jgi:hypothetical protein
MTHVIDFAVGLFFVAALVAFAVAVLGGGS